MSSGPISKMPLAISIDGVNDLMEVSQSVGGGLYNSKRIAPQKVANLFLNNLPATIVYEMDGGSYAISTGVKGYIVAPFDGRITSVELLSTLSGSMVIDIWKCSYAQFDAGITHPVAADSITGTSKPTLSSASKYTDSVLSNWTIPFSLGDVFAFDVVSNSTIQHVTLALNVSRTIT